MKRLSLTLTGIMLMLTSFCSYGQSISTSPIKPLLSTAKTQLEKPVNKDNSTVSVYGNDTLIKKVDEVEKISNLKKAQAKAVEINDTETWGEWQVLGTADVTSGNSAYSDFQQEVTVYQRFSTVTGHEKIFQLKIPEILDGYDAIFWGEANDRQPYVTLKNEYIDYDHTYSGYSMVGSGFVGNIYYKAMGKIFIEYLWHFVNTNHSMGLPVQVAYTIQLRDMPEYSDTLGKYSNQIEYYPTTVDQAIIDFTRTENIAEIRYKVTATGYPGPNFDPYFPTVDYDNDEGVVVLGKDENSITIELEGRQEYILTYMCYTADGIAIYSGSRYFWSMLEDGKQWKSLGNAKYADKFVQWHCVSGNHMNGVWFFQNDEFKNLKLVEWDVELQQCVDEPTLYRLVNPYANCPYIGQEINLMTYEQDDTGEYIGSVYATYTPQYDNTQNYYLYIYSNNELQSNQSSIRTQFDSLSGFKYSDYGDKFDDCMLADTYVFTESNYIDFNYGYTYAKLPGYIDYKFTTDYDKENDIITVNANDAENSNIRYQFTATDGSYTSEEKDLPASGKIDLNGEDLTKGDTYNITISNYDSDDVQQASKTIKFTYGFTEWELWNTAPCNTIFGDENSVAYRRHEKSNPNHEQYKFEMEYGSLLIDAADVTNLISNRYTPVTVPAQEIYGGYWMADAYTYTGNEIYKEESYFDAITGKFTIYAVYYTDSRIVGATYDTYTVDGYANLAVTLGDKTIVDGKYVQEIKVELENCAYAKYGFFSSDGYDADEALSSLITNDEAPRITESTTLKYSDVGKFYFVAVAYDDNGNDIIDESISFKLNIPVDFSEWTPIGKSSVTDGWVIGGAFGETPSDFVQEVDTYVRNDNNDIIGLYAMYNNDFYVNNLFGQTKGDDTMIVIDASARNFIMIAPQNTGCATYNISVANYEGYQYSIGNSKDDIIANRADDIKTTYNEETNMITIPKSIFIFDGWATDGTTSYIILPEGYKISGVSDISIGNNSPVEYYNLNGVRINSENIIPGLYIRRQGEKVTKVIVK